MDPGFAQAALENTIVIVVIPDQIAQAQQHRWVAEVLVAAIGLCWRQRQATRAVVATVSVKGCASGHGVRQGCRLHGYRVRAQEQVVEAVPAGDARHRRDRCTIAVGQRHFDARQADFAALRALVTAAAVHVIPDRITDAAEDGRVAEVLVSVIRCGAINRYYTGAVGTTIGIVGDIGRHCYRQGGRVDGDGIGVQRQVGEVVVTGDAGRCGDHIAQAIG